MNKTAIASTALLILIGSSCAPQKTPEQIAEEARQREQAQTQQYNSADGIARYDIPFVDIKTKKKSFTLDLEKHLGNEAKAQHIELPVSEEYFNKVNEGDELESKFNTAALILDGDIESYSVSIDRKFHRSMNCLVRQGRCEQVDDATYSALKDLNAKNGLYTAVSAEPELFLKDGATDISSQFSDSCDVVLKSQKANYTLDIGKHIENMMNEMKYPVSFPRFMCEELSAGKKIEKNFVGWSLIFSNSPSEVTYTVESLTPNY
jgi:hypothetical protein